MRAGVRKYAKTEKGRATRKRYEQSPKGKAMVRFLDAKRRAAKMQATPSWLCADQKNAIALLYTEAVSITDETGIAHEVDHIIPLINHSVCGLHVPWNLEVLTAEANRRKSNTFDDGWS